MHSHAKSVGTRERKTETGDNDTIYYVIKTMLLLSPDPPTNTHFNKKKSPPYNQKKTKIIKHM